MRLRGIGEEPARRKIRARAGKALRTWTALLAIASAAVAAGVPAGDAVGQEPAAAGATRPGDFSLARIHASSDFSPETYDATWLSGEAAWARVEPDSAGRSELWRVDADSGERERLIAAAELIPAGAEEPIAIEGFDFSADGRRALIFTNAQQVWRARTKGTYYVFDLETRSLTPVSEEEGWQMFAKFSPDGTKVAFVRDHDIWLADLTTGAERALTTDGDETIINGTTDWVYEEELGLRDAFRWNPDGTRIAYWRLDQSPIREFHLIDETSLYPELIPVRYPKAGTENSRVRVGSLELATGETTWFDLGPEEDIYVPRMEWAVSSEEVVIQRLNRHQNRLELLLGDAGTGETRVILTETDDAWVDVIDGPWWIDDGERFLWLSERDGFNHLYLYERDGTLVRQVTGGSWDVTELYGVDEGEDRVYLAGAYASPRTRQVLSVPLRGGEPLVLLGGRGVHGASFGPESRYFIDRHSTIDTPPTALLYRVWGGGVETVRALEENAPLVARLDSAGVGTIEFLEVEAADGTPLNAYVLKPRDFDPSRRYGLLVYAYGGPGSQTVIDRWGGSRALWHQYLAKRGILVASVDNRGTGGRGREFKKQVYLRLGQLETADQLAAISQLADLPYVDPERIGIWGWSYGGYMTLNALLHGGDRLVAGVSVAPVTHWKLYDTIYTERYMRTPEENPDGYEAGSPLTHAAKLESPLLLIHGTGDDNVHFQNTLLMVHELERANRHFDLRIYPNKRHGIEGPESRLNLYEMATGFVLERLGEGATAVSAGSR